LDIKAHAESESSNDNDAKLLEKWNKLNIYRMGFSVVGIGALLAALVI
jgi:hypothetical protein